jgi:hypothetical protein
MGFWFDAQAVTLFIVMPVFWLLALGLLIGAATVGYWLMYAVVELLARFKRPVAVPAIVVPPALCERAIADLYADLKPEELDRFYPGRLTELTAYPLGRIAERKQQPL